MRLTQSFQGPDPIRIFPGMRQYFEQAVFAERHNVSGSRARGEFGDKRTQELVIGAPAPDRASINGLPHLRRACGPHRPLGAVKVEAACIPGQAAMGDDAPRGAFEVIDHIFIADVEDAPRRQHAAPVGHEGLIVPVVTPELGKVVAVLLSLGKKSGKTRHAGVERIPEGVNDDGVGQRQTASFQNKEFRDVQTGG